MSWAERLTTRPVAGVCVALAAALLGVQAGPLVWTLSGHPPDAALTQAPAPMQARPDTGGGITAFAGLHPFGVYTPPGQAAAEIAETGLGLTLHGVVVAAPAQRSRAFIERAGAVSAYAPGDTITSGVRLETVHPRHVVLEVGGVLETLSMPQLDTAGAAPSRRNAGVAGVLSRLSPSARATAASRAEDPGPAGAGDTPQGGAQAVIDTYRRRIEANPQAVLDSLSLEATDAGYRIGPQPPEAVRRAGLQPGDVVTRVNGRTVGDVSSDRRLYDLVAAEGRARVEVRRGDRTITLTFPLQ
ncbi:MAG: type II secretion system protein N [Oceanicaulis sp.]